MFGDLASQDIWKTKLLRVEYFCRVFTKLRFIGFFYSHAWKFVGRKLKYCVVFRADSGTLEHRKCHFTTFCTARLNDGNKNTNNNNKDWRLKWANRHRLYLPELHVELQNGSGEFVTYELVWTRSAREQCKNGVWLSDHPAWLHHWSATWVFWVTDCPEGLCYLIHLLKKRGKQFRHGSCGCVSFFPSCAPHALCVCCCF